MIYIFIASCFIKQILKKIDEIDGQQECFPSVCVDACALSNDVIKGKKETIYTFYGHYLIYIRWVIILTWL